VSSIAERSAELSAAIGRANALCKEAHRLKALSENLRKRALDSRRTIEASRRTLDLARTLLVLPSFEDGYRAADRSHSEVARRTGGSVATGGSEGSASG